MESTNGIQTSYRDGNLHVDLFGNLTPEASGKLKNTIAEEYRGEGNIFINTSKITSVTEESKNESVNFLDTYGISGKDLCIIENKIIEIDSDKVKVFADVTKKTGCCGNCPTCKCHDKN